MLSFAFTIWLALWVSLEGQPEEETATNFSNKYCRNANRREFPRLKILYIVKKKKKKKIQWAKSKTSQSFIFILQDKHLKEKCKQGTA